MKRILRVILFWVLSLGKCNLTYGASILVYHSVGDNDASFTVSLNMFELQMNYIKKLNVDVLTVSDLINKYSAGEDVSGCACLTFDDGYKDNIGYVIPTLKKLGLPASFFVTTGHLGSELTNSEGVTLPLMTKEDIAEHSSSMFEFLPHSAKHTLLDTVDISTVNEEIVSSRDVINNLTGLVPKVFSYPRGRKNKNVVSQLIDCGFSSAVGVRRGLVKKGADIFDLPRNTIMGDTTWGGV